ncbi:hypothetical protein JRI60_10160 [Archangium violaceum]|uniref:hypothetical protein n=1 Tax=Archangium violaceum TaxID=83451 RepID=UPI0019518DC6|nr:hypothetical protein [Archangium violaceum]QRN99351.1 hypothetical protein JRI60_10160 [Archangium violaceum]
MHADVPPAFHFVLAQAPTPPVSSRLEVPPQPATEVRSESMVGTHPMLVMGTPEAAFLWPLATFTPPDNLQLFISAKLVHPAWKTRKPDFSSGSYTLQADAPFDLAAVRDGKLKSLKVSISKAGAASPEWKGVEVQVKAIPWHSQLHPRSASVPRLLYRVFGSPGNTFLVHELSGSPDFHHVLKVKFKDRSFTAEQLALGPLVDVNDMPNVRGARLKLGDSPQGTLLDEKPVSFKVERELLFHEVVAP